MSKIAKDMVTDMKQVVGGQMYVDVMCLQGHLSVRTICVVGVPAHPRFDDGRRTSQKSFFGKHRVSSKYSKSGTYDHDFSYHDLNIEDNGYNDHSLWRFNSKTMAFLTDCQKSGRDGIAKYLAVLRHHKRGATYAGRGGRFSNERWAA